ncbi:MAG: hypothetical protein JXB85_11110 [Anaerolineales bacterium]|nr:hypothetical protein [Anaerolineales bacterium]
MKKIWVFISLAVLIMLLFATTQVLASPAEVIDPQRTPDRTPGARATENADRRATEGRGNSANNSTGNSNPHGRPVNFRGVIAAVDGGSLTVDTDDGGSVTVALTEETRIRIPTQGNSGSVAGLQPGLQVLVQAVDDGTGALTARSVQVIPGRPVQAHNVGTVTDYQPGVSITIEDKDGNVYTYLLTEATRVLPAEREEILTAGARVTIIAPRDVTTLDLVASGIVVHPAQTDGTTEP